MWSEFFIVLGLAGFIIGMPLLFTQTLSLKPEYLAGLYSVVAALAISGPLVANKVVKDRFGKSLFSLLFTKNCRLFSFFHRPIHNE